MTIVIPSVELYWHWLGDNKSWDRLSELLQFRRQKKKAPRAPGGHCKATFEIAMSDNFWFSAQKDRQGSIGQ